MKHDVTRILWVSAVLLVFAEATQACFICDKPGGGGTVSICIDHSTVPPKTIVEICPSNETGCMTFQFLGCLEGFTLSYGGIDVKTCTGCWWDLTSCDGLCWPDPE